MKSITITIADMETVAERLDVVNQSVRVLQRFDLESISSFIPHPEVVIDAHGRETLSGITDVIRDNDGGITRIEYSNPVTGVEYFNPKDSAEDWAMQLMRATGCILILPASDSLADAADLPEGSDEWHKRIERTKLEQVRTLSSIVKGLTGRQQVITLEEFDEVLKVVYRFYTNQNLVPDIYNSDTVRFPQDGDNFAEHRLIDAAASIYSRNSNIQQVIVLEIHPGDQITFESNSPHIGLQHGEDKVVILKDGEEWHKIEWQYARSNLRKPDGQSD